jgi:serine/threonine protein kinase
LSEEQVLDWTVQLLSAVNYMHSRRVLHRDLKARLVRFFPIQIRNLQYSNSFLNLNRNIFLRNEIVKIGDFGISRILQGTMDMASTFTGTPYYMSPEVLKHEGYNSKSDVWSVGCLLYEMCTYQHAFEGQGLMGVMYKIVEGRVPELPSTYSRELNGILKKRVFLFHYSYYLVV